VSGRQQCVKIHEQESIKINLKERGSDDVRWIQLALNEGE
jgi:hypothetical protein